MIRNKPSLKKEILNLRIELPHEVFSKLSRVCGMRDLNIEAYVQKVVIECINRDYVRKKAAPSKSFKKSLKGGGNKQKPLTLDNLICGSE